MNYFKQWLYDRAYDIGIDDELLVEETAWGKTISINILEKVDEFMKDTLTQYTEFLLKEGYCDSDVYCEPPSAIDRFLTPQLRDK